MSESILWNEMGNLHMRLGSYEDAVCAYGKAIELSPDFSMAYNNLGHAFCSKGDYEGAIPLFQKSIDLSSSVQEQSIAWKRMGDAYQKQGNYEKALVAYKTGDELDALAGVGLINPFADLALDVKPDPIVLDEALEEMEDIVNTSVDSPSPEADEDENDQPWNEEDPSCSDEITSNNPDEILPPAIPPFYPALEIAEDEFQSPEPLQCGTDEVAAESLAESKELPKDNEEEYGEFNNWLRSIDKAPLKNIRERENVSWDEQPTKPGPVKDSKNISRITPSRDANYVMLETETRNQGILLFSDQDLWGSLDVSAQPQVAPHSNLTVEQSSTQLVEVDQVGRSSDLFKSWRLSENPEHDPNIWKSMLETLEKNQDSVQPEVKPLDQSAHTPVNPSSEAVCVPTRKLNVSRELLDGIENYKKITSMASLNDKAWDTLGKLLKDAGEFDEAVDAFQRAISICPNKDLYHYHLGLVFAAQKNHEKAIDSFQKVVEINPGYTLAHCALAGSYRRLGRETEANTHIKVALPRLDMETEYNRACFEAICGNTDQAIELLKLALDMKQTSPEWVRGDPDLDFIRDDPRFQTLVGAE
jgi:tetratricopeptide (TPR) repeat protein